MRVQTRDSIRMQKNIRAKKSPRVSESDMSKLNLARRRVHQPPVDLARRGDEIGEPYSREGACPLTQGASNRGATSGAEWYLQQNRKHRTIYKHGSGMGRVLMHD